MANITKRFETWRIDRITPYDNNPRKNKKAVPDVIESIRQTANIDPIEVDENGVILSGHTRLMALKQLGYSEAEVIIVSGLTEKQKRKYRILANKTAEKSDWDIDKLLDELDDLDFDGYDFGFDLDDDKEPEKEDGEVEFTEELLLTHNYIVLYFDNDLDWNVAVEKFGLKKVKDLLPRKSQPVGIGRVINGKKVLEWLN